MNDKTEARYSIKRSPKIAELMKLWKINENVVRGAHFISNPEATLNFAAATAQENPGR
jgi:hypothetical protein